MCMYLGKPKPENVWEIGNNQLRFELFEQCILSHQMSDQEVLALIKADALFAEWLKSRINNRLA